MLFYTGNNNETFILGNFLNFDFLKNLHTSEFFTSFCAYKTDKVPCILNFKSERIIRIQVKSAAAVYISLFSGPIRT